MTLGDRIAQKRKAAGLSQEDLGAIVGVSRQTIYKWESNQAVPELDKLIQLSQVFDISLGWLVNEELADNGSGKDMDALYEKTAAEINTSIENLRHKSLGDNRRNLIIITCLLLLIGIFGGIRLISLEKKYQDLQQTVANFQSEGRKEMEQVIAEGRQQIGEIVKDAQETLNEYATLLASKTVTVTDVDLSRNAMTFDINVCPKNYHEGMRAVFHLMNNEAHSEYEGEFLTDKSFSCTIETEISDFIELRVEFITGDTSEIALLEKFQDLYALSFGNYNKMPMEASRRNEDSEYYLSTYTYVNTSTGVSNDFAMSTRKYDFTEPKIVSVEEYLYCDESIMKKYENSYVDEYKGSYTYQFTRGDVMIDVDKHSYRETVIITDEFGRKYEFSSTELIIEE